MSHLRAHLKTNRTPSLGNERMKLAWPIFWRVLVFLTGLSVFVYLTAKNSAVFLDPALATWIPMLILVPLAVMLLLSRGIARNGLLRLLWGERLQQSDLFWRRLDASVGALFLALAGVITVVSNNVPAKLWAVLSIAIALLGLLAFAFTVPEWLAARSPNSPQQSAIK